MSDMQNCDCHCGCTLQVLGGTCSLCCLERCGEALLRCQLATSEAARVKAENAVQLTQQALKNCSALADWAVKPGTVEHVASQVATLCNIYASSVHTIGLLDDKCKQAEADLATEREALGTASQESAVLQMDLATERRRLDVLESALSHVSWYNKSWILNQHTLVAEIVCAKPGCKWVGTQRTHSTLRAAIDAARKKEKG